MDGFLIYVIVSSAIWFIGSICAICYYWGKEGEENGFIDAWMSLLATPVAFFLVAFFGFLLIIAALFGFIPEWLHKFSIRKKTNP